MTIVRRPAGQKESVHLVATNCKSPFQSARMLLELSAYIFCRPLLNPLKLCNNKPITAMNCQTDDSNVIGHERLINDEMEFVQPKQEFVDDCVAEMEFVYPDDPFAIKVKTEPQSDVEKDSDNDSLPDDYELEDVDRDSYEHCDLRIKKIKLERPDAEATNVSDYAGPINWDLRVNKIKLESPEVAKSKVRQRNKRYSIRERPSLRKRCSCCNRCICLKIVPKEKKVPQRKRRFWFKQKKVAKVVKTMGTCYCLICQPQEVRRPIPPWQVGDREIQLPDVPKQQTVKAGTLEKIVRQTAEQDKESLKNKPPAQLKKPCDQSKTAECNSGPEKIKQKTKRPTNERLAYSCTLDKVICSSLRNDQPSDHVRCPWCLQHGTPGEMVRHVAKVHLEQVYYNCSQCDSWTNHPSRLENHMLSHPSAEMHSVASVCHLCKMLFNNWHRFVKHLCLMHCFTGLSCQYCEAMFLTTDRLTAHREKNHKDRSPSDTSSVAPTKETSFFVLLEDRDNTSPSEMTPKIQSVQTFVNSSSRVTKTERSAMEPTDRTKDIRSLVLTSVNNCSGIMIEKQSELVMADKTNDETRSIETSLQLSLESQSMEKTVAMDRSSLVQTSDNNTSVIVIEKQFELETTDNTNDETSSMDTSSQLPLESQSMEKTVQNYTVPKSLERSMEQASGNSRSGKIPVTQFLCTICDDVTFSRMSDLAHHMDIHVTNPLVCGKCRQPYASQSKLARHVIQDHQAELLFCYRCPFVSVDRFTMRRHRASLHRDELYVCDSKGPVERHRTAITDIQKQPTSSRSTDKSDAPAVAKNVQYSFLLINNGTKQNKLENGTSDATLKAQTTHAPSTTGSDEAAIRDSDSIADLFEQFGLQLLVGPTTTVIPNGVAPVETLVDVTHAQLDRTRSEIPVDAIVAVADKAKTICEDAREPIGSDVVEKMTDSTARDVEVASFAKEEVRALFVCHLCPHYRAESRDTLKNHLSIAHAGSSSLLKSGEKPLQIRQSFRLHHPRTIEAQVARGIKSYKVGRTELLSFIKNAGGVVEKGLIPITRATAGKDFARVERLSKVDEALRPADASSRPPTHQAFRYRCARCDFETDELIFLRYHGIVHGEIGDGSPDQPLANETLLLDTASTASATVDAVVQLVPDIGPDVKTTMDPLPGPSSGAIQKFHVKKSHGTDLISGTQKASFMLPVIFRISRSSVAYPIVLGYFDERFRLAGQTRIKKPYICQKCNELFDSDKNMMNHWLLVHRHLFEKKLNSTNPIIYPDFRNTYSKIYPNNKSLKSDGCSAIIPSRSTSMAQKWLEKIPAPSLGYANPRSPPLTSVDRTRHYREPNQKRLRQSQVTQPSTSAVGSSSAGLSRESQVGQRIKIIPTPSLQQHSFAVGYCFKQPILANKPTIKEPFVCKECRKSFDSKKNLVDHWRSTHVVVLNTRLNSEKKSSATIPSVMAVKQNNKFASRLVKRAIPASKLTCDAYVQLADKGTAHKCGDCERTFDSRQLLMDHWKLTHGLKFRSVFVCSRCSFVSGKEAVVTKHLEVHNIRSGHPIARAAATP